MKTVNLPINENKTVQDGRGTTTTKTTTSLITTNTNGVLPAIIVNHQQQLRTELSNEQNETIVTAIMTTRQNDDNIIINNNDNNDIITIINDVIEEPPTLPSSSSIPRLIVRNLPFNQSLNKVQVFHNQGFKMFLLLKHDWFHVLLRMPTYQSLLLLLSGWTLMIVGFAGFYVWYDNANTTTICRLGFEGNPPIDFGAAFAFSLQTCTTVGYTLPSAINSFFEHCPSLQILIYFQMVCSMMFNAFLFAAFYARLAKANKRGAQVVFSNKAIVTVGDDGNIRFQVRVYDVDGRNPVVEAHIRLYAVMKERPVPRPLRLVQPNDEFGAMMFLSIPTVVTHQIDLYSILHPPQETPIVSSGLVLRYADSVTCNREEFICPVCCESYGTYERWRNHVKYQRIAEENGNYPVEGTHLSLNLNEFMPVIPSKFVPTQNVNEIKDYFEREISEVVAVVEAIEPLSSGTFASYHSYQFEDIVFHAGARFRPCLEAIHNEKTGNEYFNVDLNRFHDIELVEIDTSVIRRRSAQYSMRPHDMFFSIRQKDQKVNTTCLVPIIRKK